MPRVGFEPTISAGERPKTYALDRAATGTGQDTIILRKTKKCETGIRKYYNSIQQKTKIHKYVCCLIYDAATTYNI